MQFNVTVYTIHWQFGVHVYDTVVSTINRNLSLPLIVYSWNMPLLHTKCTASIQQGHFTCVCDVNIAVSLTGILWPLQVFHIHVFLGLQDILRLWIYAARLHHTCRRHRLCYHRVHLLPAECRGLSVVSECLLLWWPMYVLVHWANL